MNIVFDKYHGTGNDFIMIDNRSLLFDKKNTSLIANMCSRRFGIGADGLILLQNNESSDFEMVYFNTDGNESTMCGNGGRCIIAFAKKLGLITEKTSFKAIDGLHHATIDKDLNVNLQMIDVKDIEDISGDYVLDTGSPHYVKFIEQFSENFVNEARSIRNTNRFIKEGINVNFIKKESKNQVEIRTFERGVEDETFACGTGCVASALSIMHIDNSIKEVHLKTKGGNIKVCASLENSIFKNVWLFGPTKFVYSGIYKITM